MPISKIFKNPEKVEVLIEELKEIASHLWNRGWSEKSASNISFRLPESIASKSRGRYKCERLANPFPMLGGNCYYITGTGSRMIDVSHDPLAHGVFIQFDEKGEEFSIINPKVQDLMPSSELDSHLGIHNLIKERDSAERVVLHTHATEIIALTQYNLINNADDLNKILWGMQPGTIFFIPKGVGFVPYRLPGTKEIAELTINSLRENNIVVWQKHGIFSVASTLTEAFDSIDVVCKSAKIFLQCKASGFEPTGLSQSELEELKNLSEGFKS